MKKELSLIENNLTIEQMKTKAELLVKSGFLPKTVDTAEKAVAIMILGNEYGISPMKAFQSIDVIDGKPALSAQLQLALCHNTGELEDIVIEHQDSYCKVTMKRKGRSAYISIFGDKQAREMKAKEWDYSSKTSRVINLIDKYNYRTMKSMMYEWRAISRACRVVFPDAVLGLYTPDELEDVITQSANDKIMAKAEIADATVQKKAELEAPIEAAAGTPHEAGAEIDLFTKVSAHYIQDERFAKFYPDKTVGEIYADKTDGGKPKGKEFLLKVAAESRKPDDRATIEKFIELVEAEEK